MKSNNYQVTLIILTILVCSTLCALIPVNADLLLQSKQNKSGSGSSSGSGQKTSTSRNTNTNTNTSINTNTTNVTNTNGTNNTNATYQYLDNQTIILPNGDVISSRTTIPDKMITLTLDDLQTVPTANNRTNISTSTNTNTSTTNTSTNTSTNHTVNNTAGNKTTTTTNTTNTSSSSSNSNSTTTTTTTGSTVPVKPGSTSGIPTSSASTSTPTSSHPTPTPSTTTATTATTTPPKPTTTTTTQTGANPSSVIVTSGSVSSTSTSTSTSASTTTPAAAAVPPITQTPPTSTQSTSASSASNPTTTTTTSADPAKTTATTATTTSSSSGQTSTSTHPSTSTSGSTTASTPALTDQFPEDKQTSAPSGCYIKDPISIGLPYKKALIPLTNINYQISIVNGLAHITMIQQYNNPSSRYLNVLFSFPLQPQSAIYQLKAEFGNTVVNGIVKQKDQAQKQFDLAKSQGKQAILAQIDTNSRDIINLDIGNIPPREKVTVTISFVQEMELSLNMFYRIQVPSSISPRYMNSVPLAKPITPQPVATIYKPSVQTLIPTGQDLPQPILPYKILPPIPFPFPLPLPQPQVFNNQYTWSFSILLAPTRKPIFYSSLTHKISKVSTDDNPIKFQMDKDELPNRDFVFVYTPEDFQQPTYAIGTSSIDHQQSGASSQRSTTVMVSFIPKFSALKPETAYENLKVNKSQEFDIGTVKGQYIFILDRSGSMDGTRIQKAKQALIIFLKSLPPDSYFNVISFGYTYETMYPKSVKYEDQTIRNAIAQVQAMSANFGGTEIYEPLKYALTEKGIDEYPRFVFLLSDGTVTNTESVISMAKQKSRKSRISSIGIGNGASLRLIQGTAEAGRGKFVMIEDSENPSEKIISLLESSLTPVITKLTLDYTTKDVLSIVPNPKTMPYILKDSIVSFYITYKAPLTTPIKVSLQYRDSVSNKLYTSDIEIDPLKSESTGFVETMAHFKVLRNLEKLAKDSTLLIDECIGDYKYLTFSSKTNYTKQAEQYSIKYQILSQYTSFVGISSELLPNEIQKFKQVGYQFIEVPQTKPVQYVAPTDFSSFARGPPTFSLTSGSIGGFSGGVSAQPFISFSAPAPTPAPATVNSISARSASVSPSFSKAASGGGSPGLSQSSISSGSSSSGTSGMLSSLADSSASASGTAPAVIAPAFLPQASAVASQMISQVPQAPSASSVLSVDSVASLQNANGSWSDSSLIDQLSQSPDQIATLAKNISLDIIITKLVLLWLQGQGAGKQYSLIIKKAESWLTKTIADGKVDEAKINAILVK